MCIRQRNSIEKHSGQVDLDHPVIDKRPDGYYMYFHDLPQVLLHNPIHLSPEDLDENQTTD